MKGPAPREGRREFEPLTSFAEAQRIVRSAVVPLATEEVALEAAAGRVLAETVVAAHPVPPFDNSMVDGFAVRLQDVVDASAERPAELTVAGEVAAGAAPDVRVVSGGAVRIMTGAPVPAGTEAIVMLEWTAGAGGKVRVERAPAPGQFIRKAGEDVPAGETVLRPGQPLGPAALGVLASLGHARVRVHRRPRVAVLATGDELLGPDEPLAPGKIRSSNSYTLVNQVREAGGDAEDLGLAPDDADELARRLERGRDADVLVTSGGVSVGDRDEVQDVLLAAGFTRLLWRVATSPGKPLLFGTLGRTLVFGLPGNPVSSMVSFENFVRPVLRLLQGDLHPDRPTARARLLGRIAGPDSRRHFARVRLACDEGGFVAREVEPRGSGNLRSMLHANALAVVPEGKLAAEAGETVEVLLLGPPDAAPDAPG